MRLRRLSALLPIAMLSILLGSCDYYTFIRAENYIRSKKFYLAIEEYISFAQDHATHKRAPEALYEAARLQIMMLNKPDEAVKTYQALVQLFPVNEYTSRAQKELADIQKNYYGNFLQAIVEYEKFLKTSPDHTLAPKAMYEIAQCYTLLHKHDQAAIEYEDLVAKFSSYEKMDEVFYAMGSNAYIDGQYAKALKAYNTLMQRYPKSDYYPQAVFGMGSTYEEMDEFAKAQIFYEKALPIYPSKEVVMIRLAAVKKRKSKKLES